MAKRTNQTKKKVDLDCPCFSQLHDFYRHNRGHSRTQTLLVPPEYAHFLTATLQFHFLEEACTTLSTLDRSRFNARRDQIYGLKN